MANKDPKEEDDKVAAAYENISKKLDSLRNGGGDDEDETEKNESDVENQDDAELAEWKGPKPMKDETEDDEDQEEIRRVKLKNLASEDEEDDEDSDESKESDESEDEEESDKDTQSQSGKADEDDEDEGESTPKKKWEPGEDDPLDEEEEESGRDAKSQGDKESEDEDEPEDSENSAPIESGSEKPEVQQTRGAEDSDDADLSEKPIHRSTESSEASENEKPETKYYENESEMDFSKKKDPQPDTLDDLAEDAPRRGGDSDEEEYAIPNLKGSRQEGSNIGYNAHPETESFARGYQDRNMDNMQNNSGNADPNNFFSQHSQNQAPKRANKFHLLVLVIIGVAVIGFTVYILKGGFGQISMTSQPSPSPSAQESASPTPTPTPEPDRAQYKIRVLNGTSTSGLAGTVSDKLKELGYEIEKKGNAPNQNFKKTEIKTKASAAGLSELLLKDLSSDYPDASNSGELKDTDAADAEVILGEE